MRREEPGGGDESRAEVLSREQEEGRRSGGAVGGWVGAYEGREDGAESRWGRRG